MKFILNKDKLTIEDKESMASGSIRYYEIPVETDETWENLSIEAVILKENEEIGIGTAVINGKVYIDRAYNGKYLIGFKGYTVEYALTEDVAIDSSKTYYTRSGSEGSYVYTKVEEPAVESISTYYEATKNYQVSTKLSKTTFLKGAGEVEVENEDNIPSISEWEVYVSQLEQFIDEGNEILEDATDKIQEMTEALEDVNTAIEETNNLDLDANKVNKTTTVTLTKKDNTSKVVQILDGLSLEFMWQGTSLGIRVEGQQNYVFVDLQGIQRTSRTTGRSIYN